MDFLQFAAAHGLLINKLITGKIIRCATVTKKTKRNGAYYFDGDFGWCQNWQSQDHPEIWVTDKEVNQIDLQKRLRKSQNEYAQERAKANQVAILKANDMLARCRQDISEYFARKGYPEMCFNVLFEDGKDPLVCVPMRIDGKLSGLQTIAPDGAKKFLYGTNASMATFDIGRGGLHIYTEGLATAITAQTVISTLKIKYTIHCCFSASNLKKVALKIGSGIILADNDKNKTGENAAKDTGLNYFISPVIGQDFNDFWLQNGTYKSSMELKKLIYK